DEEKTDVELFYDPIEGWSGNCTCEKEEDCHHQYAAMRALLAEHSTAVVRNLSSTTPKSGSRNVSPARTEAEPGLNRRLTAALGRSLSDQETKSVRQVQHTYAQSHQRRSITRGD